ncbi:MAG TPA: response regulator [Chloroflexota bacterium]|nr:response regulator [Chloroflexota bacterium]
MTRGPTIGLEWARRYLGNSTPAAVAAMSISVPNPGVLVIEEDADLGSVLQFAVEEAGGVSLGRARDTDETLRSLRNIRPALIVLDLETERFNGLDIARRLKADPATRDIPIIAITDFEAKAAEALGSGCDHCLGKPFDLNYLIDHLRPYLAG